MADHDKIVIRGAKENNLKNVSLEIPRNRLVVMTGLSGSGKTSLAFDTIYAEGQRRYVESLSAYARQFLGGVEKPNVESIEGLSPAISIDQKTTSNNPRSTVGTVTEIYDYLRLLYARVGVPYCPKHNIPITGQTIPEMSQAIMEMPDRSRLTILAPIVKNRKGTFKDTFAKLLKEGYIRVRCDGEMRMLEDDIVLEKNIRHDIEVVIDRIIKTEDSRSRINDSLETALRVGEGRVIVSDGENETMFSSSYACPECGFSVPNLEPRLFSFNAPLGACENCKGLGFTEEVDIDELIPDREKTIRQGAIRYNRNIVDTENIEWQTFEILCKNYDISLDVPISSLSEKQMEIILHGSDRPISYQLKSSSGNEYKRNDYIEGIKDLIERRYRDTSSSMVKDWLHSFMKETQCPVCKGKRLNPQALSVRVGDRNISEFTSLSVVNAKQFMADLTLDVEKAKIADLVVKEIDNRLSFLHNVGLDYLTLDRLAGTLSGGEAQRIRLATQIGSRLSGVLYVMDEPSIGLHQRDNSKLIATMKDMRDLGNSLIVVEHDEETMMESDWIIDVGPGAGVHGGQIMAQGTPQEIMESENSITGAYLSGRKIIPLPEKRRKGNGNHIEIKGAAEHNLKNINVKIPLGMFVVVTGVSGSGKSTLVNDVFMKAVQQKLGRVRVYPGKFRSISGLDHIDAGQRSGLVCHISDTVCTVHYRFCIWHGHHCCHTTAGSCSGTCLHIFFISESRISQMYMKIHKARHDIAAGGVHDTVCFLLGKSITHYIFPNINIFHLISSCRRINHPAIFYDQIHKASCILQNSFAMYVVSAHILPLSYTKSFSKETLFFLDLYIMKRYNHVYRSVVQCNRFTSY